MSDIHDDLKSPQVNGPTKQITSYLNCGANVLTQECIEGRHYLCKDETHAICIEHNRPICCKCDCHKGGNL